ncbi:MAG TPA: NAD(P)-dependent oxidoreductase [Isosphaeraceae bacterium]|nr:NAD(P)-dependent oxidoreductase [Isosphaeraceae bacterium]
MTVLVTGANGFVGSHVVRRLLASDVNVAAMVRPGSSLARLEGLDERLEIMRVDLADADEVRIKISDSKPDACIHLAWYAEPGKYLDAQENLDSLRYSLNLVETLGRTGCRHMVGVGTCFEYELGPSLLTEDSVTKPQTLYAAAKLAFSLVAAQRLAQLGIGMAWARLFYMYGPYEDERRLVPAAINALAAGREFPCTSGEQVRDYMHIEDVASGICELSRKSLQGTFNVCSGRPVTVATLVQTLGELLGRPDLIRMGAFPNREWDPPFVGGDSLRLRTEAQWSPRYQLSDGLAATVEWWKRQPVLRR